jgi:hypothetical protein
MKYVGFPEIHPAISIEHVWTGSSTVLSTQESYLPSKKSTISGLCFVLAVTATPIYPVAHHLQTNKKREIETVTRTVTISAPAVKTVTKTVTAAASSTVPSGTVPSGTVPSGETTSSSSAGTGSSSKYKLYKGNGSADQGWPTKNDWVPSFEKM